MIFGNCTQISLHNDCSIAGDIWAVSENAVFRFKVTREERNVWQIFSNKGQFELAKKYSRGNEPSYNHVLIKEADMLFENGHYETSAQRYAETQSNFEEICLKLIEKNQQDALKLYLRSKLDTLKAQDKTQITMIVIWIVEVYLSKLEEIRLRGFEQSAKYDEIQKEFEVFLALEDVSSCIRKNKTTVYDLMASHGDKYNLMKQTIVNKDFEQVFINFFRINSGGIFFFRRYKQKYYIFLQFDCKVIFLLILACITLFCSLYLKQCFKAYN